MKLIVGLGNPGQKYEATRHNAGFWFVEHFAARSGTVLRKDARFQALVGRHEPSGVWLVLPQSYMNSSGRPVQMMASFFKIAPADVLVVHDELDFPPGVVKVKQGGGIAGHNGLKDISGRLGSHDYWRLRIGIGHPDERRAVTDFVLHKPAQEERAAIDAAIDRALDVLPLLLGGDMQGAMLKLHTDEKAAAARPQDAGERTTPEQADTKTPPPPPGKTGRTEQPEKAKAAESGKPAQTAVDAEDAGALKKEPATAAEKKGALGAFLKKFLPDTDPKRKK
ncbi:MAG: aminoacyl-tRNA hydrolase [Betaproteobacteria bacterium]|nr:aminoacyl-tRNA hydrolase [Gammaproteobacteria bacterium]MDH3436063.1 aminoacyl-tRNA hydrolase [Betaproteobacteria bacterium]